MAQTTIKTRTAVAVALTAVAMMALGLYSYKATYKNPEKNVPASPAPGHAFDYVKGSYAMWDPSGPIPSSIINNPGVVGILGGDSWTNIEKTEGVYDWTSIDNEIAQAEKAGLKVALKIVDSPAAAPDWLKNKPGIKTIDFIDTNQYHKSSYCKSNKIPVFWDTTFNEKKKELIRAAGQRYANNPAVVAVMASFANTMTNDWGMPHKKGFIEDCNVSINQPQDMLNAGYTTDIMFNVGKEIIDTTAAAFPNQALKLPLGVGIASLDGSPAKLAKMITDYAYQKYPKRFYAQINALNTRVPTANQLGSADSPAEEDTRADLLNILKDHAPYSGWQMVAGASNGSQDGCRQNGKQSPCPVKDVFQKSVDIGLSYNPSFLEYWKVDAANPELYPVIKYATEQMKK